MHFIVTQYQYLKWWVTMRIDKVIPELSPNFSYGNFSE